MRFSSTILRADPRRSAATTSSSGWRSASTQSSAPVLSTTELAEIVAWHDERALMDYVTCGTGQLLRLRPDHADVAVSSQQLGVPFAAALKSVVTQRAGPGREPHPHAGGGRGGPGRRPRRHGQHRPRADRRPAPRRQGARRPSRRGAAVHLVQPAVLGPSLARLLDLVPGQPVGGARVRVGRRPVRAGRRLAVRARGRWRSGRAGGRAGRGRAWPSGDARWSAARQLGGQFRLAGLQPSRDQITDLIAWYGRRLDAARRRRPTRHGRQRPVSSRPRVRTRSCVATGSRPPRTGFQRALPMVDRLPGADAPGRRRRSTTCSTARPSSVERVLVLDDLGDWRGLGTAVFLAESGHEVTIATSAAVVAGGLFHSAADVPLRRRFAWPPAVSCGPTRSSSAGATAGRPCARRSPASRSTSRRHPRRSRRRPWR